MDNVDLRPVVEADLAALFEHQRDEVACRMAAFTVANPQDRAAFDAKWARLLRDPAVTNRTIRVGGVVVGSIASFTREGDREITYWIAREHWGRGFATAALARFLDEERTRPLFARVAKDNVGSTRVLTKCGFAIVGADRGFANARGCEIDELILRLD